MKQEASRKTDITRYKLVLPELFRYCTADWEVIRVEEYRQNWSAKDLESVVICYCQYSPVETPLEPLPKVQTTEELQEVIGNR